MTLSRSNVETFDSPASHVEALQCGKHASRPVVYFARASWEVCSSVTCLRGLFGFACQTQYKVHWIILIAFSLSVHHYSWLNTHLCRNPKGGKYKAGVVIFKFIDHRWVYCSAIVYESNVSMPSDMIWGLSSSINEGTINKWVL